MLTHDFLTQRVQINKHFHFSRHRNGVRLFFLSFFSDTKVSDRRPKKKETTNRGNYCFGVTLLIFHIIHETAKFIQLINHFILFYFIFIQLLQAGIWISAGAFCMDFREAVMSLGACTRHENSSCYY